MVLNEFLKARRQVDVQQKQIEALTAGSQKVNAELELGGPAPQTLSKLLQQHSWSCSSHYESAFLLNEEKA